MVVRALKVTPYRKSIHPVMVKIRGRGYGNLRTMSMDKWVTSKSTQFSTKVWVKLLLLLENALKLNFEALSLTLYHTEKQGFGKPGFQKKIPDTPTKTR